MAFRRSKARLLWVRSSTNVVQATGSVTYLDLMSGYRASNLPKADVSVVRMIGGITGFSNSAGNNVALRTSLGHRIGQIDDVAVTTVDPFFDPFADWFQYQNAYWYANVDPVRQTYTWDIRSGRKIQGDEETIFFVLDNSTGSTISWAYWTDALIRIK